MADLISRAAAIDALTDQNIEKNFDSVYDGELHRTKRAAMRIIAGLPAVDAVPVEVAAKRLQRAFFSDSWEAWAEWLRRNYSDEDSEVHE